jgi:hypothetical protein
MVLYFANSAKANDFVITFNGLVKRSSKGSPATLSTSFDKIKSPAGTNAVVTVDFSMMKTEDLENGSDVFVMLEALYENSIEEAKTKNTHVTSVPAGASEKEFAKARAANPYRVRLGKGKPAGAPADKVKEDIEESASKAALEDFMYALPKAAIEELRPVMKMKQGVGRMAKITAVLKKHGITQKFMGAFPTSVVNDYFDTFHGESVELESDGINESMNNYLAFYNGKKITVQAETSYKAQLKAIEMFKAPASKKHMVNVKLAGGGALANNESVEENEEKIDEQSVARRLGQTIGALRHGKPTPKDRLDDLTVERKRRDYQKKLKNDPVFQAQNAAAKKEEQDYIKAEIARLKTFLTKEEVESVEESLAQPDEKVIGIFYEKTQNNVFEYRMSTDPWGKSHGLPHEVCVGPRNFVSGAKVNWRAANVKATVCYIAVDELEDGKPDIDKWNIKKHFKYVKAN